MDADAVEDNAHSGPAAQGEESDGEVLLTTSFGLVMHEPYDPIKHVGEDVAIDLIDGRRWAMDQIYWVLLKGEVIPRTGVRHGVYWAFDMEDLETQRLQIVTSDLPSANLPPSLTHGGARTLCCLEWQLDSEDVKSVLKVKNRRFYSTKRKFWKGKFMVQLGFDPQARRLSVAPLLLNGTAFPASSVTWVDADNLDDGCSVISMPPPMYSLMRPESFASSIFRRFARGDSRDNDNTEDIESDPPA